MAINFPEGTQNYPGKIVKATVHRDTSLFSSSAATYYWGGQSANDGGLAITCRSTSNLFVVHAMIAYGECNINGGMKLLVNGNHSNNGQYYWGSTTTDAYVGGSTAYTGAYNTADDSLGNTHSYSIQPTGHVFMSHPSCTFPASTFYLGWFHQCSGSGAEINVNRQGSNNGGRGVCQMVVYELEP